MHTAKFNDPAGTTEQQICENTCGVKDAASGETKRESNGIAFDVLYIDDPEDYQCHSGLPKCFSCPHLLAFFTTLP